MPSPDKHFYEFGPFRLDPQRHRLLRNGELVHLSPKAFEALSVFVQNPGKMLEREVLMQAIWADTFVEDANLTVAVSQLRKALSQNGDAAEYIETLPRIGYRFVADVRQVRAAPLMIEKHTLSQTVIEEEMVEDEPGIVYQLQSGERPLRKRLIGSMSAGVVALITTGVVSAVGLAGVIYSSRVQPAASSTRAIAISEIRSIAVLPPRPLTNDGENNALSLGVADGLITRLGRIRRLSVRPTSSITRFVETNKSAVEIGRSLGVDAVLEGTLQRDQAGVRVTLRLFDVATQTQLWSGHVDETAGNIFKLQDAVAQQVGEALFAQLSNDDKALLVKQPTANAEAYANYLKGNYFWSKRGEKVADSFAYFRKAIELDPNFAQAYAALAAARSTGETPSPEAEALVEKALQLDNTLSAAHATYGFIQMFHRWNWPAAEQALDRAIELDPNSVTAHHWKGVYLSLRGRLDEAKSEMYRALELDPLSLIVMADLGQLYYFAREYDQAIDYCNRALALDSEFSVAHEYLAEIYRAKGMEAEAAEAWIKRRFSKDPRRADLHRQLFARSGLSALIKEELRLHEGVANQRREVSALIVARGHLRLGNPREALSWLEHVFESPRWHWQPYSNVDPLYDELRNDPRFQSLMRRMHLP